MTENILPTTPRPLAAIILAAGSGTRMKSSLHKVLHPLAGKPMLHHLLDNVARLGAQRVVVVVGANGEQVESSVAARADAATISIAWQREQLGTGHAVAQAEQALASFSGDVLILYGDVPLVSAATLQRMVDRLHVGTAPRAVVLAFRPDDAAAYGRVIARADGELIKMVEYKDATDAERAVNLCNSGLMAVPSDQLFTLLASIGNDNAAGEYYLPDIVMLPGQGSAVIEVEDPAEVAGVNSRAELAQVEAGWQARRRAAAMADGVTLIAPETVWFSHDTQLARDVTVEPNVWFGPDVRVGTGANIRAFSHIAGADIGPHCEVGPYARLRPGAALGEDVKIGNFV
ncbi:MAG: NTP transferase domain-containing protein, partial [Sphingopyxis sp.]